MTTFAVLGAGGWGTALALVLSQKPDHQVRLWCARSSSAQELLSRRENIRQLPGIPLPDAITITTDEAIALEAVDCVILAVPTAFLRPTLERLRPGLTQRSSIPTVSLTKGIEVGTFLRPSEVLTDTVGERPVVVLSGPSHAEEVARGLPTSVVAASPDATLAGWVQEHFGSDRFRVYTNTDIIGVELSGALKNVIGIAAGVCDGLQLGDNAKAALLTRGLVEMTRFGVAHGAEAGTFTGLAGMGDLMTTCFSPHGRNRRVGDRLARGEPLDAVLAGPQVAEGVYTARSVYERIQRMGLEAPILTGVYQVLYEGRSPSRVVHELLSRRQRGEHPQRG